MLKAFTLLIFTTLLLTNSGFAQDDGFVEADAHEHGAALMTLAIEDNTLVLDFISPSFNIVGFEYAPKTDEEKAAVSQALSDLGATANLMSFSNGASCSLVTSNIASEMSEDEHHDEHGDEHHEGEEDEEHHEGEEDEEHHEGEEDEEHHEGEEDEEHHEGEEDEEHHEGEEDEEHHEGEEDEEHHEGEDDEEHHEGEDDEEHHDEHDEEGDVHSEFHASYEFNCNNMNRLAEIDFSGLFAQYPNVLDVDLQYVTDDTQGAVELNPDQTVLKF